MWIWFLWLALFYAGWSFLVFHLEYLPLALDHWPMAVAMALGSYAAGSTPMGGGTVGFPVLVLLQGEPATLGRDFSFAVQSIGMVSASIFILARRQPLASAMLGGGMAGSLLGTPLGILFFAPTIPTLWIKLLFAVIWASFGILHFYRIQEISSHVGMTDFDERWDFKVGFVLGLFSAIFVSSVTGVGIDMVLYAALVLLCRTDLKIAIPSSVVLMAFTSLLGVGVKALSTGLAPGVFGNWLAAAPVVALGAPLGVFIVQKIGRKPTLLVVAVLCVGQFIATCHAEWAALGWQGLTVSLIGVGMLLLFFEWLRRWGIALVAQARGKGACSIRAAAGPGDGGLSPTSIS
jgi:uncharacterized membrane protein YfcA